MHLPWMGVAGLSPKFIDQTVGYLLQNRTFNPMVRFDYDRLTLSEVTGSATANYYADIVQCNNTADMTLSLHPAASMRGRMVTVKKTSANIYTVTIDPNASESIGLETSLKLFVRDDTITFYSDGSNWQLISDARYKHMCKMRRTSSQTITTGTATKINLNSAPLDTVGSMGNTSSNRVDILRSGLYLIIGQTMLTNMNSGKQVQARLRVNDSYMAKSETVFSGDTDLRIAATCVTTDSLSAGAFVELGTYQDSGGDRGVLTDNQDNMCQMLVAEL